MDSIHILQRVLDVKAYHNMTPVIPSTCVVAQILNAGSKSAMAAALAFHSKQVRLGGAS